MQVKIVPYDPAWPERIAALAYRLREALGPVALRIDHIGSTSVPGLAAKPIIDVQISVASFDPLVTGQAQAVRCPVPAPLGNPLRQVRGFAASSWASRPARCLSRKRLLGAGGLQAFFQGALSGGEVAGAPTRTP